MHWTALMMAAALGAPTGDVRRAAQLEAWGDLAEARAEVDVALARDAKDPGAVLVAACLDLEEGKLDAARARAEAPPLAELPQARVLRALVERRRAHPEEKLRDALAPAWKAAGRPELNAAEIPGLGEEDISLGGMARPLAAARRIQTSAADRYLFVDPVDPVDRLEVARLADRNPRVVNHQLVTEFVWGDRLSVTVEREAARHAAASLLATDPENGYYAAIAVLVDSPAGAPLRVEDVERLEEAVRRPRFELPRAQLVAEARALARKLDPEHAECRGLLATLRMATPLGAFQARIESIDLGQEGASLKVRAANAAAEAGRRMATSRTLMERMVGLSLLRSGAKLSGDPHRAEEAKRETDASLDWYRAVTAAARRGGTWPLSSICADWSPDEVTHFERFLD